MSVFETASRWIETSDLRYYTRSAITIGRFALDRLRYRRLMDTQPFTPGEPLRVGSRTVVPDNATVTRGQIPPIIWMYWHRGAPTRVVELVRRQLEILNPAHEVRLVTQDSVVHWLPDFRMPSEAISVQHFSDILRLDLLARYGGIWCDASLIFFVPLETVFDGHLVADAGGHDLLAYYIERFSAHRAPPIIENWFLAAPPASPVIEAWRAELEPMREGGEVAMSVHLKALPDYAALKQHMLMEEYLVSHIALQHALAGLSDYALCLERAEDEAFALQVAGNWNPHDLIRRLLAQPYAGEPPRVVKLAGYDRHLADLVMRRGIEHPDSLLGRLNADRHDKTA